MRFYKLKQCTVIGLISVPHRQMSERESEFRKKIYVEGYKIYPCYLICQDHFVMNLGMSLEPVGGGKRAVAELALVHLLGVDPGPVRVQLVFVDAFLEAKLTLVDVALLVFPQRLWVGAHLVAVIAL